MAHLKFLEQFDTGLEPGNRMPPAHDLPGYDAGFEAGVAAAKADQASLNQSMIDKLVEVRFAHAEAQQQVLASLRPLFHAICDQILPGVANDVRNATLIEAMTVAAQNDVAGPLQLSVHPKAQKAIATVTATLPDLNVILHADPSLGADEILISFAHQETQLDVANLIDNIKTALLMTLDVENKAAANG